jgi:hypothetical protein
MDERSAPRARDGESPERRIGGGGSVVGRNETRLRSGLGEGKLVPGGERRAVRGGGGGGRRRDDGGAGARRPSKRPPAGRRAVERPHSTRQCVVLQPAAFV